MSKRFKEEKKYIKKNENEYAEEREGKLKDLHLYLFSFMQHDIAVTARMM